MSPKRHVSSDKQSRYFGTWHAMQTDVAPVALAAEAQKGQRSAEVA